MDIVFIRDLEVYSLIGVYDWERRAPRPLRVSVELATDATAMAKNAPGSGAPLLDYAEVCARLEKVAAADQYYFIENLAEAMADCLLRDFPVPWLRLELIKPGAVAAAREVGTIIERRVERGEKRAKKLR